MQGPAAALLRTSRIRIGGQYDLLDPGDALKPILVSHECEITLRNLLVVRDEAVVTIPAARFVGVAGVAGVLGSSPKERRSQARDIRDIKWPLNGIEHCARGAYSPDQFRWYFRASGLGHSDGFFGSLNRQPSRSP